jgi:hypothetical protein
MKRASKLMLRISLAAVAAVGCLFVSEQAMLTGSGPLVSQAEAVIGRPLTPMSYAGVARRTTRRAVATGAAAGAAAATVVPRAGCVQAVNAYGQVYWRCP